MLQSILPGNVGAPDQHRQANRGSARTSRERGLARERFDAWPMRPRQIVRNQATIGSKNDG